MLVQIIFFLLISEAFSFLTRPVCVCVCFWWVCPGFGEKSIKKSQLATKKEIGNQQTGVVVQQHCIKNMCFRSTRIFDYSNINIWYLNFNYSMFYVLIFLWGACCHPKITAFLWHNFHWQCLFSRHSYQLGCSATQGLETTRSSLGCEMRCFFPRECYLETG